LFSRLAPPPDPFDLSSNLEIWEAHKPIVRVHHCGFGATEFNPGVGSGRFHPLRDTAGHSVPTIYGSNSFEGALSETVFHGIPAAGPGKFFRQIALMPLLACTLQPARPLRLVQLRGYGLSKLGLTRAQIIDSDKDEYPVTRAWGAALYHRVPEADGLIWMSRQHDSSEAIVLFGTRIRRDELTVTATPRPLYPPSPGWQAVLQAAEAANIRVILAEEA
jgi:RES domain